MNHQQQALLTLMQAKYGLIRDIETRHQIFGHEGDYRPRIEYYHDAVRTLGNEYDDGLTKHSRLSVERLAYDVEMLRLITARPLVAGRGDQHFSTSDALVMEGEAGESVNRPDRRIKQELSQNYKDYTVYFIALMVDKMEGNAEARKEESDLLIEDCHRLENLLTQLANGSLDIAAVVKAANHLEHDGLRRKILALLSQGIPSRTELQNAAQSLRDARGQVHQEIQELDKAAMRFVSSQLMVYEGARDIVKGLAGQGINIAGKFTENAIQTSHGRGTRGI